jgi:CTP synthase
MRLGEKEVLIKDPSMAFDIYKQEVVKERFRHRYEVNPDYVQTLTDNGLIFSGIAKQDDRIMQIIELPKDKHKFFFATQFHPELTSKPLEPNPVFARFVKSCLH